MNYTIRDDIPAPVAQKRVLGRPWLDVNVGQCVEVLLGDGVDVAAIRSSCAHTKRREGKEFIVRVFRDENLVRIWRTR